MKAESRKQKAEVICAVARALRYPVPPPARFAEGAEFFDEVAHVDPSGMEELYTRTFDLNPVATLEVGWHLWGEQYERGRFLADLRELQAHLGIDCGCELPDHLTVLLPTIAAMPDNADLRDKCSKAIEKILVPLEAQGNPYRHLLRAALSALAPRSGERVAEGRVRGDAMPEDRPPHPASGHLLPRAAGEKALGETS
jgi:nitrate reductase assembly molybdenum cofactor insertion protein NarJ